VSLREIVLDTETTGLNPATGDRIVEIAAVEMVNKVVTNNVFHAYVNPERDMPSEAYRIHGISGEFLKDKPLFKDISNEFIEFIGTSPLVIHNAQFDIRFINHEFSMLKLPLLELSNAIDTLPMARAKFPGIRVNLDALCRMFNVDNSGRKFHGALKDSYLLAQVYVELTGGRQNSFNLAENKNAVSQNIATRTATKDIKRTALVEPSHLELARHKEFLAKIFAS
jgi:DNA polymerase III subunit epsilon